MVEVIIATPDSLFAQEEAKRKSEPLNLKDYEVIDLDEDEMDEQTRALVDDFLRSEEVIENGFKAINERILGLRDLGFYDVMDELLKCIFLSVVYGDTHSLELLSEITRSIYYSPCREIVVSNVKELLGEKDFIPVYRELVEN